MSVHLIHRQVFQNLNMELRVCLMQECVLYLKVQIRMILSYKFCCLTLNVYLFEWVSE